MMNKHYPWATGLQIPNDVINVWEAQAAGSDLLRWALANGKILEHVYLEWAKNYYKLPSLSHSFFQKSPDPALFEKWGAFDWSGTFLPIYEFDGTLYIACLEPPNPFQQQLVASLGVRTGLLLAPILGMKNWWTIISPALEMYKQVSSLPPELAQHAQVGNASGVPVQPAPVNPYENQAQQMNYQAPQTMQQAVTPVQPVQPVQAVQQPVHQPTQPVVPQPTNQPVNYNQQYNNGGVAHQPVPPVNPAPTYQPAAPVHQQPLQTEPVNNTYTPEQLAPVEAQPIPAAAPVHQQAAQAPVQQPAQQQIPVVEQAASVEPQQVVPPVMPETPVAVAASLETKPDLVNEMPPLPGDAPSAEGMPEAVNLEVEAAPEVHEEAHDYTEITQVQSLEDAMESLKVETPEPENIPVVESPELPVMEEASLEQEEELPLELPEVEEHTKVEFEVPVAPSVAVEGESSALMLEEDEPVMEEELNLDFSTGEEEALNTESAGDLEMPGGLDLGSSDEMPGGLDLSGDEDHSNMEMPAMEGLDLTGIDLGPDLGGESPLEEMNGEEQDQADELSKIEGLDLAQFQFDAEDVIEDVEPNRPPSAHMLDTLEDSIEMSAPNGSGPLKVEHPEAIEFNTLKDDEIPSGKYSDSPEKRIAHEALEKIAAICNRRMILQMNQGVLKPFLWEGEWAENTSAVKNIELMDNSIFRIVANTKMAYHGYVVRNEVNDQFLDAFNKGKLPDHATLIPVLMNKNIVAVILGFCEKERADEIDLHAWERIADEYANDIIELNRTAVAA